MKFSKLSLLALMSVKSATLQAETITTAEIVSLTTSAVMSCAEYRPVGVCFWLRCTLAGCDIETSVKFAHYNPELTFQTYRDAENPPWSEAEALMDLGMMNYNGSLVTTILETMGAGLGELGGGAGSENKAASHSNLTFTLTDAFGNPAVLLASAMASTGYVCDPDLTPFYPYYISNMDLVSWRFGIPEMFYPESLNPFGNELGSTTYNWGGYYPRIGYVTNHDPLKESGLIAFRAAHFITRDNQDHIYTSIDRSGGSGWWPPGPLTENSGKWQQLSPKGETSCHFFPLSASTGPSDGLNSYRSDDGAHVWNLWREYKCCERRGAFLYDVEW